MAMNQFLRMLVGRKWLFLTVLLLVMALGIGGTMLWPKRYTAEVNVLLDLRNPDAVSGVPGSPTGSATYLATEIDVVRSQRVALRVVDSLNLAANKELRKQFSDSKVSTPLREWIADLLVSQLKVKPSREPARTRSFLPCWPMSSPRPMSIPTSNCASSPPASSRSGSMSA
jgi:uncharacterized protein involved in exopolysaccharide biosynthesis